MSRSVSVVVLLLLAASAGAQAPAARLESAGSSHVGAPALKVTTLRGQGAVMFGSRGGWSVSPTLTLGGGACATMTEVDARDGAVPFAPRPLDLKFECFGVELAGLVASDLQTAAVTLTAKFGKFR